MSEILADPRAKVPLDPPGLFLSVSLLLPCGKRCEPGDWVSKMHASAASIGSKANSGPEVEGSRPAYARTGRIGILPSM